MGVLLKVNGLKTHVLSQPDPVRAVDGVSFTLQAGEILGVAGESGSGKTLSGLSIIGLTQEPVSIVAGEILFNGENLRDISPEAYRRLRGRKIAMVFQDPMMTLNPVLRIDRQMIETILAHETVSKQQARKRCIELLGKVGISDPEQRMYQYPHELSGGMRQRVAIAIAMLLSPELIIADEPTTALDVSVQAQILREMQSLCKEVGTAMIWITHDLSVLAQIADRILVMYRGKIVESGTARQVLLNPEHSYTRSLLAALPSAESNAQTRKFNKHAPIVLSLASVHKTYGQEYGVLGQLAQTLGLLQKPLITHAVIDASLDIRRGEFFALVGESGSGKSTLGRIACGLLQPDTGSVEYENVQSFVPGKLSEKLARQARLAIQMVFQDPQSSLNPRMRVIDIVGQAPLAHNLIEKQQLEAFVSEQLSRVGLDGSIMHRFPHEFSGGQRQRISIARALAVQPKVLVLDEALASLDVSVQKTIMQLLMRLREDLDLTYIFISHDLSLVEHISDRVAVMQKGRIVELGNTREVFSNPQDTYTRTLLKNVPRIDVLKQA